MRARPCDRRLDCARLSCRSRFTAQLGVWRGALTANMPSMLDARVSLSLMDVVRGENQFDEEFEWVEADEVFDLYSVEGKPCFLLLKK